MVVVVYFGERVIAERSLLVNEGHTFLLQMTGPSEEQLIFIQLNESQRP